MIKPSQLSRRGGGEQLSLDPLELETLADKSAFDRALVYQALNLSYIERVEIEARLRALIARRIRRRGA